MGVQFIIIHDRAVILDEMASNADSSSWTLRITGLGHSVTLDNITSTMSIGGLKQLIEQETGIPSVYMRLLARGKKLDLDEQSLEEAGLENRTKIMLLRNALYTQEKESVDSLALLRKEIEELEAKKDTTPNNVITELVTRLCCKLDSVDTKGSDSLRALRKSLIGRVESIDSSKSQKDEES